jgi:hypothetical protein
MPVPARKPIYRLAIVAAAIATISPWVSARKNPAAIVNRSVRGQARMPVDANSQLSQVWRSRPRYSEAGRHHH